MQRSKDRQRRLRPQHPLPRWVRPALVALVVMLVGIPLVIALASDDDPPRRPATAATTNTNTSTNANGPSVRPGAGAATSTTSTGTSRREGAASRRVEGRRGN